MKKTIFSAFLVFALVFSFGNPAHAQSNVDQTLLQQLFAQVESLRMQLGGLVANTRIAPATTTATSASSTQAVETKIAPGELPVTIIRLNATGPEVARLQQFLVEQKFLDAQFATGVYNTQTADAVRMAQSRSGAPSDGIWGPTTFNLVRNSWGTSWGESGHSTLTQNVAMQLAKNPNPAFTFSEKSTSPQLMEIPNLSVPIMQDSVYSCGFTVLSPTPGSIFQKSPTSYTVNVLGRIDGPLPQVEVVQTPILPNTGQSSGGSSIQDLQNQIAQLQASTVTPSGSTVQNCSWGYFEGESGPVRLVTTGGQVLSSGIMSHFASNVYNVNQYVNYPVYVSATLTIPANVPEGTQYALRFRDNNPNTGSQNSLSVPVVFQSY
jgi:peptidoglycan hydrolase-like protein with peptidoglycan-binding domain